MKIYLQFIRNKKRMEELAEKLGRTHPKVLAQSRVVDKLVLQLQGRSAG